eukprot:31047-Pelagococcus_subviridis.AAC.7
MSTSADNVLNLCPTSKCDCGRASIETEGRVKNVRTHLGLRRRLRIRHHRRRRLLETLKQRLKQPAERAVPRVRLLPPRLRHEPRLLRGENLAERATLDVFQRRLGPRSRLLHRAEDPFKRRRALFQTRGAVDQAHPQRFRLRARVLRDAPQRLEDDALGVVERGGDLVHGVSLRGASRPRALRLFRLALVVLLRLLLRGALPRLFRARALLPHANLLAPSLLFVGHEVHGREVIRDDLEERELIQRLLLLSEGRSVVRSEATNVGVELKGVRSGVERRRGACVGIE